MAPWVQLFCSILETELPAESTTQTETHAEILALNKQPCWVLKGVVAQITLKLFQKSGNKRIFANRGSMDSFIAEFDA